MTERGVKRACRDTYELLGGELLPLGGQLLAMPAPGRVELDEPRLAVRDLAFKVCVSQCDFLRKRGGYEQPS